MLAALNDLDVMGDDAEGACLNADSREKLCSKCDPEIGEKKGLHAIIVRALHGRSKSAAASWRDAVSKVFEQLGFQVWRPRVMMSGCKKGKTDMEIKSGSVF